MSWFDAGLETLNQLTETVQKASETVKQAIPVDKELLAKLTLNTDEMKAERQKFGEEAAHKAEVKDVLAGLLPWETRDSERDILVEECKEAILALSRNEQTFFGPYEMPSLPVKYDDEKEQDTEDEDDKEDDDEEEEGRKKVRKPSEESLEKLAKLEPLPPLLRDFDLDTHVGLIKNILNEDPFLVRAQSTLSGGGAREKVFWHNYFFHCAYTRYEAGLSIDEIWSYQPEMAQDKTGVEQAEEVDIDETVVFDESTKTEKVASPFSSVEIGNEAEIVASANNDTSSSANADASLESAGGFELLDDDIDGSNEPELDELEAEIARELED